MSELVNKPAILSNSSYKTNSGNDWTYEYKENSRRGEVWGMIWAARNSQQLNTQNVWTIIAMIHKDASSCPYTRGNIPRKDYTRETQTIIKIVLTLF